MNSLDYKMDIRKQIEDIFKEYRRHKYYTLFMESIEPSITSSIDEIGGGQSNMVGDKVGNAAIKYVDTKEEAKRYVDLIERSVEQLPSIEKELITIRYMSKDYNYMNDFQVYNNRMTEPISAPYYNKVRARAIDKLAAMLLITV